MKKNLNIYIDEHLYDEIKIQSNKYNVSMSGYVESILRENIYCAYYRGMENDRSLHGDARKR